jgi:uncharacterized phage protein (TIGR01671 family)
MQRETLFRGKRKKDGEWVYGFYRSYIYRKKKYAWLETIDRTWEIKPETVGEYTGLEDKNGVKIFEGDIVSFWDGDIYECSDGDITIEDRKYKRCKNRIKLVVFDECCFRLENYNSLNCFDGDRVLKVIGNIHDAPGLLKG